jgi:EAL domain-containing protein (putative c-di-GMP-specific phosphodiesterase class I)
MTEEVRSLLIDIIENNNITAFFQAIFCSESPTLHGYEVLIRGPFDSLIHSPLKLFSVAIEYGLLSKLELACQKNSIKRFVGLD